MGVERDRNLTEETKLFFRPDEVIVQPDGPASKPAGPDADQPTPPLVVLDMGEASREQGFRLNGCR
jgi:hypothetical protein